MKGLNCLVNNASVFENDNIYNFSNTSFLKHININLKAPAILTRDFSKIYKGKFVSGKRIVPFKGNIGKLILSDI